MKRAVIYARYSSDKQTEQSIEGQIRVCIDYAKTKDLEIVGEYIDCAISGRTDNRPEFQRLMQDCSKGIFDAVIVYRTDRFARNKYDSAIYKKQLKKNKIELHYAAEHIPEGPEGIILESLMEGLAEYYSAELSQKVKRGIHESALKAKSTGGNIALGYKVADDKSFQINEKEAEAVRIVFDMFIKGTPNSAVCEYLNRLGLRTNKKTLFSNKAIPRLVQNEKYIGTYKCGDVVIKDAIPPIVTKELFYAAQRELAKRRSNRKSPQSRVDYLLSGKLFCGHCKKRMIGISGTSKTGDKHYYYYCSGVRNKTGCDKKHVSKNWIEDLVVSETLKHILRPEAIKFISKKCYESQQNDKTGFAEIEFIQRRIDENKKALNNLLRAIEMGVETTTLPMRIKELETESHQLNSELKKAEAKRFIITPEHVEFKLLQYINDSEDAETYKKRLINSFISEVYLYDDTLLIYYTIRVGQSGILDSELKLIEREEFDADDVCFTKYPNILCVFGLFYEKLIFTFNDQCGIMMKIIRGEHHEIIIGYSTIARYDHYIM